MPKTRKTILKIFIFAIFAGAAISSTQTLWANVTYVKPLDAGQQVEAAKKSDIPLEVSNQSKARAPEPSTIALFGSGILGMIISFVRRTYAITKRIIDIIGSVLVIVIFFPLIAFVALLVRLTSRGPILYSQTRVGRNGQLFEIYKFRTMKVDAEKETGPVWAQANDKRLTPIGGILRKSHLDELPQVFNVLKGEMSLIGPRPERPVFVDQFKTVIHGYEERLTVKPGITGLAQVWHRYDETIEDVKKKVKYDMLYIKKMCLWADINIIFRTVFVVLTGKGAR
jgi:exopolysaccharide biosynthesis polyprenyl glycosylphosphotransferase